MATANRFGAKFDPGLSIGQEIDSAGMYEIFRGQQQGGIRMSATTRTFVLIAGFGPDSEYDDVWEESVIKYRGPRPTPNPKNGRADLAEFGFNGKQLYEAFHQDESSRWQIFLFSMRTKNRKTVYRFEGEVAPHGSPNKTNDGWVFPLELSPQASFAHAERNAIHRMGDLSDEEARKLAVLAESEQAGNGRKEVKFANGAMRRVYRRHPVISAYAKRMADGKCDLCGNRAPFLTGTGEPYLEEHHIEWLSRGGADSCSNVVALCPNCHRKMHIVGDPDDVKRLVKHAAARDGNVTPPE